MAWWSLHPLLADQAVVLRATALWERSRLLQLSCAGRAAAAEEATAHKLSEPYPEEEDCAHVCQVAAALVQKVCKHQAWLQSVAV